MRIAILGGGFNPIHLGHLYLADTVLSLGFVDRVVFVPAYRSPLKLAAKGMEKSANDRLLMIAVSIAGNPRLSLDACEINREGTSYTIDTLEDIITRYCPDGKPSLIIGDDLAPEFPKWNKYEKITKLADVIIARRNAKTEIKYPFQNIQITNDVLDISSAMVRERINDGSDWRSLVPEAVCNIIEDRQLYGLTAGCSDKREHSDENPGKCAIIPGKCAIKKENGLPELTHSMQASINEPRNAVILRIEEAVRENTGFQRFLHSRNTAVLAWDLCRHFGLDPDLGYLAGIAHDLAKTIKADILFELVKNDGYGISKLEMSKPSLLHGRASAVLLKEQFNIHNEDVLEAVAFHTGGREGMCQLAKVVYIADKLEVTRDGVDPDMRKMCYKEKNLDSLLFTVLENTISGLQTKKLELSEDTFKLLARMKEKNI